MTQDFLTRLEQFVEKASRPGVLGMPGRKLELQTAKDVKAYFAALETKVLALRLEDRTYEPGTARHAIEAVLKNVLRKEQETLQAALELGYTSAWMIANKMAVVQESVDEERDDNGRWTVGGGSAEDDHQAGKVGGVLVGALVVGAVISFSQAKHLQGTPYRKLNCSQFACKLTGRKQESAEELYAQGVNDSINNAKPGDIVAFPHGHVAVMTKEGLMDSTPNRGVRLTKPDEMSDAWYQGQPRIVRGGHIKESIEDEPRDEQGRWTGDGVIADKHGEKYDVRYSEKTYTGNAVPKANYDAYNSKGEHVANLELRREKQAASSSYVRPEHQRKGIGSALYSHVERHLGYKLKPNAALTDDGKAFWDARSKIKEAADDLELKDIQKLGDTGKKAADWASTQAAKLVTDLDNTTLDILAGTIEQGIEQQLGAPGTGQLIRAELEDMKVNRALTIASTEINRAMSAATLDKLESLSVEYKQWILDADPCEICIENGDAGPIPLGDDFPSGDDGPPAHPNCRCAVTGARAPEGGE